MDNAEVTIHTNIVRDAQGKPKGVLLSVADYHKVRDLLEDLADIKWMESHRHEDRDAIAWEDVKKQLDV